MATIRSIPNHPPDNKAALTDAVNNASKDRLASVLHTLLKECDAAVPILERELLTEDFDSSELDSEESEDEDDEDEESIAPPKTSKKRARADSRSNTTDRPAQKRKLYETCIQCGEEYNTLENYSTACQWHEGEKEPDYESDFWADHDERCHGIISELGDEYPEGFIWTCCDKTGDQEGCKTGRHRHK